VRKDLLLESTYSTWDYRPRFKRDRSSTTDIRDPEHIGHNLRGTSAICVARHASETLLTLSVSRKKVLACWLSSRTHVLRLLWIEPWSHGTPRITVGLHVCALYPRLQSDPS